MHSSCPIVLAVTTFLFSLIAREIRIFCMQGRQSILACPLESQSADIFTGCWMVQYSATQVQVGAFYSTIINFYPTLLHFRAKVISYKVGQALWLPHASRIRLRKPTIKSRTASPRRLRITSLRIKRISLLRRQRSVSAG